MELISISGSKFMLPMAIKFMDRIGRAVRGIIPVLDRHGLVDIFALILHETNVQPSCYK